MWLVPVGKGASHRAIIDEVEGITAHESSPNSTVNGVLASHVVGQRIDSQRQSGLSIWSSTPTTILLH